MVEGTATLDGRHARRQRNRDCVVDALLGLYHDGHLAPSTEEIAERAGISPRSLFRYFDDADDLTRAAVERHQGRMAELARFEVDPAAPAATRIAALVESRVRLHEAIGAVGVVARQRAASQPLIAEVLATSRRTLRRQIERAFAPELARLGDQRESLLAAVDVLCSFESHRFLRDGRGFSRAKVVATLTDSLTRLLEDR